MFAGHDDCGVRRPRRPAAIAVVLALSCGLGTGCYYFDQSEAPTPDGPAGDPVVPDRETTQVHPLIYVYFNDFEAPLADEWSPPQRSATPTNLRAFLGEYQNDRLTLSLKDLPPHTEVTIICDLYVIGSWDGNAETDGPDIWSLEAGGKTLLETTFSYTRTPRQSYPNSYPFGAYAGRAGAIENDSLGYSYYDENNVVREWNSVYHIRRTLSHDQPTLEATFAARGLAGDGTENWGVDNVSVLITPAADVWPTALVIEAEEFATRGIGGPAEKGWNLWQSGRITDWVRFDPRCTQVEAAYVIRATPAFGHWPILGVTIDQRIEAHPTVGFYDWTEPRFPLTVRPGVRQVGVAFTNDEQPAPGQDRNLLVDRLEFAVPPDCPRDAWPVRVPPPDWTAEPDVPATDAEVMELAAKNIAQYRQGDFRVRVTDAAGQPASGQTVRFQMIRHHFRWGTAVRFDLEDPDRPLERLYRRRLGEMFNYGTTENLLRWGFLEPERGQTRYDQVDAYLELCDRLGIELKGHNLVWGHFLDLPPWLNDDDITHPEALIDARLSSLVSRFRGRFVSYDVVNEPLHALQWEYWAGPSYVENALTETHSLDPDATLLVNEFQIVAVPDMADNFFVRMRDLLERGAPLGGVGIQLHSNLGEWYLPRDIWRGFERLAQLGVDVDLTEVSLGANNTLINGGPYNGAPWTEERQAEYYDQVMTLAFGHPKVESMTFWGFADRRHFQPGSGLLDMEFRPKAAGEMFQRRLEHDWSTDTVVTTDADGEAAFRGFFGWYRVVLGEEIAVLHLAPDAGHPAGQPVAAVLHRFGDDNADSRIDETDLTSLDRCFTGEDVRTVLPACTHFDFDGDRDVDCADYARFVETWTSATAPAYPPCDLPMPEITASGCRYLTILPPADRPTAFQITSEDWLCVEKFVGADGSLVDDPVFLAAPDAAAIDAYGPLIVPDATYHVRAFDGEHYSRKATVRTWGWGDINLDGQADDADIVLVLDGYHGNYDVVPFQQADVAGCVPNRGIDFDDVLAVVRAVEGGTYTDLCPAPCNSEGDPWEEGPAPE